MLGLYSFSLDSSWAVGPRATRGGGGGKPLSGQARYNPMEACRLLWSPAPDMHADSPWEGEGEPRGGGGRDP